MSELRKAAQQALDTMEKLTTYDMRPSSIWRYFYASATGDYVNLREFKELAEPICTDLKAALAEPVQEPVAWMYHGIRHDGTPHDRPSLIWQPNYMDAMSADKGAKAIPLYTAPPQRKPLTDQEVKVLWADVYEPEPHIWVIAERFARAIERAHGRSDVHPDHQEGMITHDMIQMRVQEEIDDLRAALAQRDPLTDDEIKCIKPVCADFVSFRAGVRQAEREHGIGFYS